MGRRLYMEENISEQKKEKAVLCGLCTGREEEYSSEQTILELKELADTAGAEVAATVLQNRDGPETATLLGAGKLEEIAGICRSNDIDLLIFDDELSGMQIKNISDITNVRVIDRTTLILDIFAKRAKSREGRLQVELAQLKYLASRLTGIGSSLSRLGGGIGTRGPGETKLETDRRYIRKRIGYLENNIKEIAQRRSLIRERREKTGVQTVAIVGYTNAGKSTLLNLLTGATVFAENKLFATLDTTSRGFVLPDGRNVIFIDTVGFIRKLPHHLVEAFHSTLEEAAQADLILNVCDTSNPEAETQLKVSDGILKELGCHEKPQIVVLNKCDRENSGYISLADREWVKISAKTGEGIEALIFKTAEMLPKLREHINVCLPYSSGGLADIIRKFGIISKEEYKQEGIEIIGEIDSDKKHLIADYLI